MEMTYFLAFFLQYIRCIIIIRLISFHRNYAKIFDFLHCKLYSLNIFLNSFFKDRSYWESYGESYLKKILQRQKNDVEIAKNCIIFIGDGMGRSKNYIFVAIYLITD